MTKKTNVFLISLGCSKNLVDSEYLLGFIRASGNNIVSNLDKAEKVVINTCGFIQPAVEETIDTILRMVDLKEKGKLKGLVVTGCFVQRYGYKLLKEIPEVDAWLGPGELNRISTVLNKSCPEIPIYVKKPVFLADHTTPRIYSTPFYTAYLKIAEGCSSECTYCLIPKLRGPFRSRGIDSLIKEARKMVLAGVKEINLIAQDITMYGRDPGSSGLLLEDLLEELLAINGLTWIRLQYCNPARVSERLLDLIEENDAICPYLDIPLQHVNHNILVSMGRDDLKESPLELLERIRSRKRRISLRTTLMVGFPGETEAIFEELYDFVKWACFDHLGVFIFSSEKGTRAARIKLEIENGKAEQRKDQIMQLQHLLLEETQQRMVGQKVPVLIEGHCSETDFLLKGRTATMAPEVDGQVLINKGNGVEGEIMSVFIREAYAYDLIGELCV